MIAADPENARNIEKTSADVDTSRPEIASVDPPVGQSWGNQDAVEIALAKALERASSAGRWDVVTQLARELEARRLALLGAIDVADQRAKRRTP